jgi:hypothetical protein
MRVPAYRSPGSARHRVATLAANYVADHWADIARHISSRPLPSVTRAGIAASRLEPPWRASRRQPGEMDGIDPIDPNPGANTQDRYQIRASADPGIQHINVPDRCPRGVGNWCASRLLTRGSSRANRGSNWLTDDKKIRVARLPRLSYLTWRAYLGAARSLATRISRHRHDRS